MDRRRARSTVAPEEAATGVSFEIGLAPTHLARVDEFEDQRHFLRMPQRYDIREDREGWTVFDLFTGEPVVINAVTQTGLDIQDADELAELLDHKAFAQECTLRQ